MKHSLFTLALALALSAAPAWAQEFKAGDIVVEKPWARATPKGAEVGSGYLTVQNKGAAPDRLTGGTADFATVEIHQMSSENGVSQMRELKDGLNVPAHGSVGLSPGGYHLMFTHLTHPLTKGESIKATLNFEHAGPVEVEFSVMGIGATGTGAPGRHEGHEDVKPHGAALLEPPDIEPPMTALALCRFAHFLAAMLAFGMSAYLWAYAPERLRLALSPVIRRLALIASILALITAIAWLALESASMADEWSAAVDPGQIGAVLTDTAFGHMWALHLALAATLVAVVAVGPRARWAATAVASGGAAGEPRPRRPRRDADGRRGGPAPRQPRRASHGRGRVDRRPRSVRDVPARL